MPFRPMPFRPMPFQFDGQTVLVTGAARGIGAACAEAFAEAGARVLAADNDAEALEAAADGWRDQGFTHPIETAQTDVTDDGACADLVKRADAMGAGLHVLVNNAAILSAGDLLTLDPGAFDRVLGVNLRAPFVLSQCAAKAMIARRIKGAIVNMSSINDTLAIPGQLAYVTAKGGLSQLTKASALALAPHGIRVNAVGPGSIATEMLAQVMTDEAARRMILSRTPLGRPGAPREIADAVLFLASEHASYMTGQTIYPDGGRLALNYTVPVPETD